MTDEKKIHRNKAMPETAHEVGFYQRLRGLQGLPQNRADFKVIRIESPTTSQKDGVGRIG